MSTPSPVERTWLDVVPVVATAAVALVAAVLAADASREVAVASGAVSDPALAWCVPVIIEGGAVTSGLLAWRRSRMGQPARPERLMLLVLVLLAVIVNAAHAASGTPLGWVVASAPPLVLVASVELLLRNRAAAHDVSAAVAESEREEERRRQKAERRRATLERRAGAPTQGPLQTADRSAEPLSGTADEGALLRQLIEARVPLTGPKVNERLGKNGSTGRRLLGEARIDVVRTWIAADPTLSTSAIAERLLVSEKKASDLVATAIGSGPVA